MVRAERMHNKYFQMNKMHFGKKQKQRNKQTMREKCNFQVGNICQWLYFYGQPTQHTMNQEPGTGVV